MLLDLDFGCYVRIDVPVLKNALEHSDRTIDRWFDQFWQPCQRHLCDR